MADSKTTPKPTAGAKPTARIDATHMGAQSMRDDPNPKPAVAEEDWGVDTENAVVVDDDLNEAEEREIEPNTPTRSQNVSATAEAPAENTTTAASSMGADDYFAMVERLEQFKTNAISDLQNRQKLLNDEKTKFLADFDQQMQGITDKLKKLGVDVGGEEESEVPVKTRRGGRRRRVSTGEEGGSIAPARNEGTTATVGRRTRPKNDKTLKEAIVEVLSKKGRVDLKTIAQEIITSGFKTNSKKFGNTVRVQLYRLDDDGEVVQYEDGTFGLKKSK